jgi:hypothetical protein
MRPLDNGLTEFPCGTAALGCVFLFLCCCCSGTGEEIERKDKDTVEGGCAIGLFNNTTIM